MAYQPGAYSETALVEICPFGGTAIQIASLIETIDIDFGDKDVEFVPTLAGGRIYKKVPQEGTTITFEGYPLGIGTADGVSQLFNQLQASYVTTEPMTVNVSRLRDLFRIAILWTNDPSASTGSQVTTATYNAYRFVAAHAMMTSMKPTYTDGVLKFTFSFKVPPFNKKGIAQIQEQSTQGTTVLAVLNTYNTTNYPYDSSTAFTF